MRVLGTLNLRNTTAEHYRQDCWLWGRLPESVQYLHGLTVMRLWASNNLWVPPFDFLPQPTGEVKSGNLRGPKLSRETGRKIQENPQPVLEKEIRVDPKAETFKRTSWRKWIRNSKCKIGCIRKWIPFKAFCPLSEYPHPILRPDFQFQKSSLGVYINGFTTLASRKKLTHP